MRPATRWRESVSIARLQALVRGADLGDVLALVELMREGLDPRLPQPLQLLPPVCEEVGLEARFSARARSSRREPMRDG